MMRYNRTVCSLNYHFAKGSVRDGRLDHAQRRAVCRSADGRRFHHAEREAPGVFDLRRGCAGVRRFRRRAGAFVLRELRAQRRYGRPAGDVRVQRQAGHVDAVSAHGGARAEDVFAFRPGRRRPAAAVQGQRQSEHDPRLFRHRPDRSRRYGLQPRHES